MIRMHLGATLRSLATAALLLVAWSAALAQEYPARTVTIVLGYAPGSGPDPIARHFAHKLAELAGRPFIVENRQGALTIIAAEAVARARPDGYTVLFTSGNSTMAANPHMFKKLSYDPTRDFTPVTTVYRTAFVLVVNPQLPVNSVAELTAYLKNRKTKANYGYSGSLGLATAELYKSLAGLDSTAISYKNPLQSIPDLAAGTLDFLFMDSGVVQAQVRANKIRALAVTPQQRASLFPDLPTMEQAGVSGYDLSGWFAVYLPANAPAAIVDRLSGWFNRILANEETRQLMMKLGADPFPGSPQSLAQHHARELEKWGRILRAAKVEPE
ncbi:MAG: hypothetical protein A3I01_07895 [Betaproteobacteria bacterium RIFCSPLOWO2_02_FULL_65_24]|nr:MAG: hypothetical protein A3I01_07895 [Betaproteobacteria bacterium RIFCSPLOWO2_02_FULL_65_24]